MKSSFYILALCAGLVTCDLHAQSKDDIDQFIQKVKVKTYDCPDAGLIPTLQEYLALPDLLPEQKINLQVQKSHWMICQGNAIEAREFLEQLMDSGAFDKQSEAYASAIYQIGFVHDLHENPKRCDYYAEAENLAHDRFEDISLSAQLGQITVCDNQSDGDGIKLGRMYALLEKYSHKGDKQAIAHIHNNIGLLYGELGQHVLAAEQYQKSYEMGLGVYTGSNLLATLISVVSSQMASGDFDGALETIEELKRVNVDVNTPLSNTWVHFAEAGYYYRTQQYQQLQDSLARWQVYLPEVNNNMYNGLFRWYKAALCLHQQDEDCLNDFLYQEEQASDSYKAFVIQNKDYLKLQVEIQLFLGNLPQAREKFELFADMMLNKTMTQQGAAKILGVANLHNQILTLESNLQQIQRQRVMTIASLTALFIVVISAVYWVLRRRYLSKLAEDPLTGLHNSRAVIEQIRKVPKPREGLTNALALFDLDNFKEMNSQFGHLTGDKALKQVAATLKSATREQDILGRLASEQFVVCLTNIEEATATHFFERIRNALETTIFSSESGARVNIHSSMSIYISTDAFNDLNDVLSDLQAALHRNNHNGSTTEVDFA